MNAGANGTIPTAVTGIIVHGDVHSGDPPPHVARSTGGVFYFFVIPAEAGIQIQKLIWIPAAVYPREGGGGDDSGLLHRNLKLNARVAFVTHEFRVWGFPLKY